MGDDFRVLYHQQTLHPAIQFTAHNAASSSTQHLRHKKKKMVVPPWQNFLCQEEVWVRVRQWTLAVVEQLLPSLKKIWSKKDAFD